MLERAKERTRNGKYIHIEYARFADDMVILINAHPRHDWLLKAVDKQLREELAKLHVQIKPYGRPSPWRELDRRRHKAHSQPPTCLLLRICRQAGRPVAGRPVASGPAPAADRDRRGGPRGGSRRSGAVVSGPQDRIAGEDRSERI